MSRNLSMTNLLSVFVFCVLTCAKAELGVTAIRQPGAPLDLSLRNEVEHAVSLAATWLAARQNADGSWGTETNRVRLTSVVLTALTALRTQTFSDACARAAIWLDVHPPSAAEPAEAHAWRLIALLSAVPDTPARSNLTQRLLQEALPHAPPPDAQVFNRLLWTDALALAGHPVAPASDLKADTCISSLAAEWPPDYTAPYCLWLNVRLINGLSDGRLERNGDRLDWRRDVAQILISSQRRDPSSGAYWGTLAGDALTCQSAFGILTLQDL